MLSILTAALGLGGPLAAAAQPARALPPHVESAWKPMLTHEGVAFSYLFYREARGRRSGLVIRLVNANDVAVAYRFTVVFRAEGTERAVPVQGRLAAGQMRTGSDDGLFFAPFADDRSIAEVGLRGYAIERLEP